MSVLVTGSAGHLGEAIVRRLRAEGRDVRGIDIKASPFTDHVGSIADEAFVRDVIAHRLHEIPRERHCESEPFDVSDRPPARDVPQRNSASDRKEIFFVRCVRLQIDPRVTGRT